MMMSIFSSFDALSAEVLGQKKFNFPGFLAKEGSVVDGDRKDVVGSLKKDKVGKSTTKETPKDVDKSKSNQQRRRTRFAPELDGVHCFETIIPY